MNFPATAERVGYGELRRSRRARFALVGSDVEIFVDSHALPAMAADLRRQPR
jgi:hypothetical protein